jgi:hypothetical protein
MPAALPPRQSCRWVGFFVVLFLLAVVAVLAPLFYNLSIQLRPEQLAAAKQRWLEQGPSNYDLEYLVRTMHGDQEEENAYLVQVRDGQAVLVVCNSDVVYLDPALAFVAGSGILGLSSEDPRLYGVSALFDAIEAALRQDESSGQRNFTTAQFDPKDGHPFHYVHRVRGTRERVEWHLKITHSPSL